MRHDFDEIVNRRNTYSTQWDYIQDRFGVKGLLPFSISDTDFRIPSEIKEAIAGFNELGIYGYSRWNHSDFKGTIKRYFDRRLQVTIEEEWVVYSPSVMYTISILLRELCLNKKKVLTLSPMYDSFYRVIEENNLLMENSTLINIDGYFTIDYEDVEEKLQEVDVFLLCSPHNPTGRLWTKEELSKLVNLCQKYAVAIISDEIHIDINLTEKVATSIMEYSNTYRQIYQVSSASKTFNIPALIGSYAVIKDDIMREKFINIQRNRDYLNSASILGIMATMVAYNECDYYIEELCEYVNNNLSYVEKFIKQHLPELTYHKAEATYLAWIDCSRMPYSMDQLQEAFVSIGKIGIMDGTVYGDSQYIRMNCGAPFSKIEEGLNRVLKAVSYLREQGEEKI